jgi:signal transduction histidine kinase
MNESAYVLIGVTALTAMLVAVLTFALLRFAAAAREARRRGPASRSSPALVTAVLQDTVARLQSQEQAVSARAAASAQLNTQIVDSLTAGLLLVDRAGKVEILNPAARRLLDIAQPPPGTDFRALLAEIPGLIEVIGECLLTHRPIVRRAVRIPDATRAVHLGVTVSPLGDADAPSGVICLFSDLTSVVELEEQLRLKEALARLGELTAGIAHEFRNGLATIHGYSRLIDLEDLPPQYVPYVEGIREEAEALGQVVTNFLNFARPEQVAFSTVNLGAIARKAADDLQHELPAGTTVTVTGTFADMQGDDVLLRQMFGNLIRNAAEACEVAGIVPAITIDGDVDARQSCVVVNDNGPGIPAVRRERIFQPFITTRPRGTGLGLAIVQKVVVMHNGRVSVQEPATQGASIQLLFPRPRA